MVLQAAKPVFASALGLLRSTVRVLAEGTHTSPEVNDAGISFVNSLRPRRW